MHEYGVPPEIVRMGVVIGILISILIYERWRVTTGAAVVAGYMAFFVERPLYIISTITIAVLTYLVVQRFVAQRMFLYGRRRLLFMVLTGMVLQLSLGAIAFGLSSLTLIKGMSPWLLGLYGIGFVLPGLIAQDIERQGMRLTLIAVLGTTLITFLLVRGLEAVKSYLPSLFTSSSLDGHTATYSYKLQLLIPAVILSVILSALLFELRGLYSGGFLTAAYAALFILQPLNLAFLGIVSILVFLFTRLLMRHTPIFGRTKFAMIVITGVVFTWVFELLVARISNNTFVPFAGFSVISPMIVALIANDGERQGLGKTMASVALCTILVFGIIKSADLLLLG